MNVTLLAHTQDCEKLLAAAARLCYSSKTINNLYDGMNDAEKMINMLIEMGHESPLEHASFTFGIEGISRACSHQLVRHRIASFSQKSQRYVTENNFNYIIPPEIQADKEALAVYEDGMEQIRQQYIKIRDVLKKNHIASGMDEKTAEKKAIEDARFVLPNACETSLIVTMNVRSLFNFFRLRCCNRAQWEIRAVADEMLRLVREVAPTVFANAGAPCISGPCDQGKMSCGKPKK